MFGKEGFAASRSAAGGPRSGGSVSILAPRCECWELVAPRVSFQKLGGRRRKARAPVRRASDLRLQDEDPWMVQEHPGPRPTALE